MSEEQESSVLTSQSTYFVDSLKEDGSGVSVMSKSKARSLRRKRAKQRKKATEIQEEKKAEPQDEENLVVLLPQGSQTSKKKKRSRRKKKNKMGEQRKNDEVNDNRTETPKGIPHVKARIENLNTKSIKTSSVKAAEKALQNGKIGVKSLNTNSMKTPILAADAKDISNLVTAPKDMIAKSAFEKAKSEDTGKIQSTSSEKKSSPEKKEMISKVLDDSVATPIETTKVEANKPNIVPTSVYEDNDENKELTKEDCACACIIS